MPELSVVVPVYNNELNLPDLFRELERVLGPDCELVFVDDGSRDGSWRMLEAYAAGRKGTKAVKLSRNFGSFTACVAGLRHAAGSAAVLISADLQDPPDMIPQMVERWRGGKKVVMAARAQRQDGWLSRLFAAAYYRILRGFVFPDMPPGGFDFVLIDRQVVDQVVAAGEKNTTLMGLILWLGFDREKLHYVRRAREKGRSMWTLRKKVKYFIDSILAFSYFPIRLVQSAGLAVAMAGFFYAALLIVLRLRHSIPIPGWTALMVMMLILGGVQLLVLGVIGEYVWRVLDETKRRPLYVVEKIVAS
jgi:dolichol-phosphate mannosyltransferase